MICSTKCIVAQAGHTPYLFRGLNSQVGKDLSCLNHEFTVYSIYLKIWSRSTYYAMLDNSLIELGNTGNCCIVEFAQNSECSL